MGLGKGTKATLITSVIADIFKNLKLGRSFSNVVFL